MTESLDDYPAVLTVAETARLLRIGRTACYAAIQSGDIPSIRVGRSVRVPRHRLVQLLGLSDNGLQTAAAPAALSVTDAATTGRPQARNPQIERPV